jgi:phospholipid-binding lipoprotein MlaA
VRHKHTFIQSLLLSAVLVIYPVILLADTSSAVPDMVQSDGQKTLFAPQVLSETDEVAQEPSVLTPPDTVQMSLQQSSNLPDTHALDEETITVLTQQNEAESKEAQEAAPVESKNLNEEAEEEVQQIPDPIAPVNKVMFHVNDKLYFWALKPVTQIYSHIIPEDFRIVFSNAYDNLQAPARIVNNLLQLRFKSAGNELIRFLLNSVVGIGGLGDVARDSLGIKKQEADFGQTLGHYGIGHGFYLVLPVFGPSSIRDGIGLVGDRFMYPLTYVSSSDLTLGETSGILAHEKVNDTSFKIGDYESFKESAIDPYVSMRDAFTQYRKKKVEESNR